MLESTKNKISHLIANGTITSKNLAAELDNYYNDYQSNSNKMQYLTNLESFQHSLRKRKLIPEEKAMLLEIFIELRKDIQ